MDRIKGLGKEWISNRLDRLHGTSECFNKILNRIPGKHLTYVTG